MQIKYVCMLMVMLVMSTSSTAQTFSRLFDLTDGHRDEIRDVYFHNDVLYCTSIYGKPDEAYTASMKISLEGDLLDTFFIPEELYIQYKNTALCDSQFILYSHDGTTSNQVRRCVLQDDYSGYAYDTAALVLDSNGYANRITPLLMEKTRDGHVVAGRFFTNAPGSYTYIYVAFYLSDMSLDTVLVLTVDNMWKGSLGGLFVDSADHVFVAFHPSRLPPQFLGAFVMVEIDTKRVVSWSIIIESDNTQIGNVLQCIPQEDGILYVDGHIPPIWPDKPPGTAIVKIDWDGNELWTARLRSSIWATLERPVIYDMVMDEEGYIYGCGEETDTVLGFFERGGYLFKLAPDGEFLWDRYYVPPLDNVGDTRSSWFHDMALLPNGHIALGGVKATADGEDAWLVVVDSNGCVEPGCGYGQLLSATEEVDLKPRSGRRIQAIPNPATDVVYLDGLPEHEMPDTLYALYTMSGQLVGTGRYGHDGIDVRDLPPSTYIIYVTLGGDRVATRFVKVE